MLQARDFHVFGFGVATVIQNQAEHSPAVFGFVHAKLAASLAAIASRHGVEITGTQFDVVATFTSSSGTATSPAAPLLRATP
jgi:hypothetical protein